ncbi:Protein TonB [Myxococcaceae bacterium]|nr:Protein TonB [Myxococcaceae bacterium]
MSAPGLPFRVAPGSVPVRSFSIGLALSLAVHAAVILALLRASLGEWPSRPKDPSPIPVLLLEEPARRDGAPGDLVPPPPTPEAPARMAPARRPPARSARERSNLQRAPAAAAAPPVVTGAAPAPASPVPPPNVVPAPDSAAPSATGSPQADPSFARVEPGPGSDANRIFGVGEVDAPARAVDRPAPVYPERARRLGREADREVAITVGRDGRVLDARIVEARGDEFDREALSGVRRWRFVPAKRGGESVASRAIVIVRFRLDR